MRAVLLLSCPDRPGIVAAVGGFVASMGANIVPSYHHSDEAADGRATFLQRIEFDGYGSDDLALFEARVTQGFAPIADTFEMTFTLHVAGPPKRIAILVSRSGHCLGDLLVRDALGELAGPGGFDGRIVAVIANHDTQRALTDR